MTTDLMEIVMTVVVAASTPVAELSGLSIWYSYVAGFKSGDASSSTVELNESHTVLSVATHCCDWQ